MDAMNVELKDRINALETKQAFYQASLEEKLHTIEITGDTCHKAYQEQLTKLESTYDALSSKIDESKSRTEEWNEKIYEIENKLINTEKDITTLQGGMNKIENIPDLTKLNSDLEAKSIEQNILLEKAENMLEKIKDNPIQSDEFNKVKTTREESSNRLDKIHCDEKMLNLLLSNLPPGLQTIQGFGNFAYNE